MMLSTRQSSSGPHRSQSRSSRSVSASACIGKSTVRSFVPTRRKSRRNVSETGSFKVYTASSPPESASTRGAGAASICPETAGAVADAIREWRS